MKLLLLSALLFTLPAFGQPVVSPDVHGDGSITFRLAVPNAKEVRLHCEGVADIALQRDEHGVWSFTTPPMTPDIYAYSFSVDGLRLVDPNNPFLKYNLLNNDSQVEVRGDAAVPWQLNDVSHGELHRHFYKSAVAGDDRDFIVYTPPGYDATAHQKYPVLYLLHGYSDDTTGWTVAGRANVILDNLIAQGKARPMIVVMPLGYGTMDVLKGGWSHVHDQGLWQRNMDNFRDALLTEVIPRVEKEYRVKAEANSRAIAGLSMGGSESLVVGLNHPDLFGWIGAFSSGGLSTNYTAQFPKLDAGINNQLHLLWIGCGDKDQLLAPNRQFCDWLQSKGVHYNWVETDGVHSFRVWRRNLATVAPLLFH
jgi:enterochelin esterase family protein